MFPYPTVETATSDQLDALAYMYGIVRKPSETDSELRTRSRDYIQSGLRPVIEPKKCECGAHKVGFTEPGIGHSTWCPLSEM